MPTAVQKLFRAVSLGTAQNWNIGAGSSKIQAIDPGEPIVHDEIASYLQSSSANRQTFGIDRNFPDSMGTITEVRIWLRYDPVVSLTANLKATIALTAGPTWVDSADLKHTSSDWDNVSAAMSRPGGGSWTEADLRDTTFQFGWKYGSVALWIRVTSCWLIVTYEPSDEGAGAIPPEFPSRRLRRARLPVPILEADCRADVIDLDLLEDFEVIHSEGPQSEGKGWGTEKWERRRFRVIENNLDLNTMRTKLRAVDLHDYACMFWHTGISPYNYKSDEEYPDGPAFLHPGSTETFSRPSKAWILNGSRRIVELNNNIKRIGPQGILLEGGTANYVINSSFINGTSGWTLAGPGAGALDTNETLFADEVAAGYGGTNQSLKLTYIDGLGEYSAYRNSVTPNANDTFSITFWFKSESDTYPGRWFCRNQTTLNYYNASTQTWQAGFIANNLPASNGIATRHVEVLNNDVTAGTILVACRSPQSPGAGDHYAHFYHVQAEWKPGFPSGGMQQGSSPIPTYSAVLTRQQEDLRFSNDVGRRIWPVKRGTFILRLTPQFNGPIAASGTISDPNLIGIGLFTLYHDTNNWAHLLLHVSDNLYFFIKAGGTYQFASIAYTPVIDTPNVIALRWTSGAGGELDLPSRTISIFLDGVQGIDAYQTADMTEVDTGSVLDFGFYSGFGFGSQIQDPSFAYSHLEILPWCLSNDELKARP